MRYSLTTEFPTLSVRTALYKPISSVSGLSLLRALICPA